MPVQGKLREVLRTRESGSRVCVACLLLSFVPGMYIFPLLELLDVAMHASPGVAITFQEEVVIDGKREQDVVVQIARRDMPKGEEIFVWPGRLSNSEMIARRSP